MTTNTSTGGVYLVPPEPTAAVRLVGLPGPNPSTVIADSQRIYVAYASAEDTGSHIAVLDHQSGQLIFDIRVSGILDSSGPSYLRGLGTIRGLDLTPSGQLFCILDSLDRDGNRILAIDATTGAVLQEWEIPLQSDYSVFALDQQLAVAPNDKVYIASPGSDSVLVFDPGVGQVVGTIPVGRQPIGVVVGSANQAYVTNYGDGTVTVIDIATDEVVGTPIAVGRNPLGLAVFHPWE